MRIRQWICFFSWKKMSPSPTLPFCMKTWRQVDEAYYSRISSIFLGEFFVSFWKFQPSLRKSTKFVFEFCGLDSTGKLAPVDIGTLSCFNQDFLRFFARAPCPFLTTMLSRKTFRHFYVKEKFGGNPFAFAFSKSSCRLFSVGIPSWMGFSRPQLTAVPGLFGWESLNGWDFLGHNLLLSQAFFGGNPLMDGIF
jgi:hypothetical protein